MLKIACMNIVLFDGMEWAQLRPLTLTKPVAALRMGILTFRERWEKHLPGKYSYLTQDYLSKKYPLQIDEENLFINPSFFPTPLYIEEIQRLKTGESIWKEGHLMAAKMSFEAFQEVEQQSNKKIFAQEILHIQHLWDLFHWNAAAIQFDFDRLTKSRISQAISSTNGVMHADNIFIEEGAVVEYSTLNAKNGPIYIGKNAEIMEGSMIRGSFALCENATVNMGTKIYAGTTVGPHCKVGGEINNSILMGYSNKGHDGFLGNSVIGEWCNLGADTNNSNLKNNYSNIRIWDYSRKNYVDTGLQFFGLVMGDYSKSAINSQFNTGTVVGISANVFAVGFPPKFIPSFSWGGNEAAPKFDLDKSFEAANKMKERRKKILTEYDQEILSHIYSKESDY